MSEPLLDRDASIAAAARIAHALVCGCDAYDWCDSMWFVATERAIATFNKSETTRARADIERLLSRKRSPA